MTTTRTTTPGPAGAGAPKAPAPSGGTGRGRLLTSLRGADAMRVLGPPVALIALCIGFTLANPRFATLGNIRNLLDSASVLAVIVVGLTFVLMLGAIDLSVEGVMAVTALTFALLVANSRNGNDWGIWALVAAVGVGALFGLASGVLSARLQIPSFMTTLGMSAIGIGVASVLFGGVQPSITSPGVAAWANGQWFGLTRLTYVAIVVVIGGLALQRYTRLGRYSRVIGGSEEIARLSGIPVRRYKMLVFVLAGALYGLAGVMVTTQLGSGIVASGSGQNFTAITAAVVGGTLLSGGRGGVGESIIGVLIVIVLSNGLVLVGVSPYVQTAAQGVIVVAAVAATNWPLRERMRVIK